MLFGKSCRGGCPCRDGHEAAREQHSAAAVRPSSPSSSTSCLFLRMGMRSIPASVR